MSGGEGEVSFEKMNRGQPMLYKAKYNFYVLGDYFLRIQDSY